MVVKTALVVVAKMVVVVELASEVSCPTQDIIKLHRWFETIYTEISLNWNCVTIKIHFSRKRD